jgi:hypothetical protein
VLVVHGHVSADGEPPGDVVEVRPVVHLVREICRCHRRVGLREAPSATVATAVSMGPGAVA